MRQQAALPQPARRPEAQRQHPELVAEFGGAETGPRAAYVEASGGGSLPFRGSPSRPGSITSRRSISAVENAFAVPGGYVYITRQLMGLMNDESELAFVLGHEIGHIAANHAQAREADAARNSLGVLGRSSARSRRRLGQHDFAGAPSSGP